MRNIKSDMPKLRHALKRRGVPTSKTYYGRICAHQSYGVELTKATWDEFIEASIYVSNGAGRSYDEVTAAKYRAALIDACNELGFTIQAHRWGDRVSDTSFMVNKDKYK